MSGQAQVQKRYDALYGDVKQFFVESTSGKMTVASVTTLTRYAMEVVQTGQGWKGMKGSEKKDLVLGVITALVEDLLHDPQVVGEDFDDGTRDAILAAVSMVPMFIDAAVDFAKVYTDGQSQQPGTGNRPKFFCCC
jgi:hypothetical protein